MKLNIKSKEDGEIEKPAKISASQKNQAGKKPEAKPEPVITAAKDEPKIEAKKTRKEGEERGRCCLSLFISLSFISILLTLFFYTNKDSATAKRDSFFAG